MNIKSSTTAAGIIYIIFGLLCIIFQSNIISFIELWAGLALIAFGIINLIKEGIINGLLMIIFGILVLLLGGFVVAVVLYIIAIAAIVIGIQRVCYFSKHRAAVNDSILGPEVLRAILLIIFGVIFLFNQVGTVNVIFIIEGIIMIVSGVCAIADSN